MQRPIFSFPDLKFRPVPKRPGWFRGPLADWEGAKGLADCIRADPAATGHHVFVGWLGNDRGHRIYVTPPLGPREMAEAFGVGGREGEEVIDRTAGRLEQIAQICPLRRHVRR